MSVKRYSVTDTTAAHFETLKVVLETTAAEYFTSYVLSEDKLTLRCMDGENPLLTFSGAATSSGVKLTSVTLSGDNVTQVFQIATQSSYMISVVTTAGAGCALKIKQMSNNAKSRPYGIFITKTNKGKTAVCIDPDALAVGSTTIYKAGWCATSESTEMSKVAAQTTIVLPFELPYTSIVNVVCSGVDDYCPDLYVTPT
ncbi:hypothetical protein, partial [uncultured Ruminococcus sp.]|uniref:hypothetical protein n=1 Tax=uncultured Ruminococcus sp. TaxID=165186 RepID=UPI0025DB34D0